MAIDGKTLRRSFDNFLDRRAAHILSAFASDSALVLAHLDCDEKSNEIPAVQSLLGSLALTDSVVTVDAMHLSKKALCGRLQVGNAFVLLKIHPLCFLTSRRCSGKRIRM